MKKIFVLLLFLTVIIGVSAVSAAENMTVSDDCLEMSNVDDMVVSSDVAAESNLDLSSIPKDSLKSNEGASKSGNSTQVPAKASAKNVKSTYGNPVKYNLKVLDKSNNPVAGKIVTFKIGKKEYKVTTDSNGIATLNLDYSAGKYTIHYSVDGLTGKNTYTVKNKISMTILKQSRQGKQS